MNSIKFITIFLLILVGTSSSFSQSKKEKLKELVDSMYSDNLYAKISRDQPNFTKSIYVPDKSAAGGHEVTDTAELNKAFEEEKKGAEELLKQMSGGLDEKGRREKTKKETSKLFDSIYTEKEINKQLSFYKSKSGNKMVYEFHGILNPLSMMSYYYRDYNFDVTLKISEIRKEKLDSLIFLIIPNEFKDYYNPFKQETGDIPKDNQNKRGTKALEIILDKMFNDEDLNYLIGYFGSNDVKIINAKQEEVAKNNMKKMMDNLQKDK